jgi:uncharacterized RDD family membrane protein YckC
MSGANAGSPLPAALEGAMADSGPKRIGVSFEMKPHAYDPARNPELFEGVLSRRVLAFAIDFVLIMIPVALAFLFVLLFGLVTFGLAWTLLWLFYPGTIIWILFYYGSTLGSPASATLGMRVMSIEMRTWYGAPSYLVLGAVHAIAFYISVSALTPLVLCVCFFNERRRLLHDIVVGTIVINNPARAAQLRRAP